MRFCHRHAPGPGGLVLLLGLASFLLPGPSSADWALTGEAGAEFDSIGEEFGAGATIDDQIEPDDPLDDLSDALRFHDRTTESSAVVSLRLRDERDRYFDGVFRLKSRSEKSRAELDLRGELADGLGVWRWGDRVYSEFAGSEADGGWLNLAELGWNAPRLFGGLGLGVRCAQELSRAGADSLASLFDYQLLRPSVELGSRLGPLRLALEAGVQYKRIVDDGNGSYDGSWVELRSYGQRLSLSGRLESRAYAHADSLYPSYQEITVRTDGSLPVSPRDDARIELSLRSLQYGIDSSIFRDHLEGDLGLFWQKELGASDDEVGRGARALPARDRSPAEAATGPASPLDDLDEALADLADLELELCPAGPDSAFAATGDPGPAADLGPLGLEPASERGPEVPRAPIDSFRPLGRWYLELGTLGSGSLGESDDSGNYGQLSGRVSVRRQADERIWLDLSVELGRRAYLHDRAATDLVFEGFDFSVSGSDYGFFEASLFGEVRLPAALSLGLFAQYEDQRHDLDTDDFRLWIVTASLVRKF